MSTPELMFCDEKGQPTEKEGASCVEIVWPDGRRSYMEKPAEGSEE